MTEKPDLSALLGSRICHDLISPIGAIGNGLELLMMDGTLKGPELALISDSVAHANARIRFFRIAFGTADGDRRISRNEIAGILSDMGRGGRLVIDWDSEADLPRRDVKLLFLLLQCLETAMPFGGRIKVRRGTQRWVLAAEAARLKLDTDLWGLLSGPADTVEVGAAQVHFLLAAEEFRRQHRRLTADLRDAAIRLEF
jgi:histidine phosphotransferase ChpT